MVVRYINHDTRENQHVKGLRLASNVNEISGVVNNPGSRGHFIIRINGTDRNGTEVFLDDVRITGNLESTSIVSGVSFEEGNEGWTLTRANRVQNADVATDGEWSVRTRQFSLFSSPRFDLEGSDKVKLRIHYKQRNITSNPNNARVQIGYTDSNNSRLRNIKTINLSPGDADDGIMEAEVENPGNGFRFTINSRRIGGSQNNGEIFYDLADITAEGSNININSVSEDNNSEDNVVVFPNPTAGPLSANNVAPGTAFEIVDITGNTIQSGKVGQNRLNITAKRKGVYFVRFYLSDKVVTKQVIKN